ncbi:hypothetical protein [uncultured Croceicoccus sp.]|uniref:hypothetical protein n=1 Tax=uncultured Croceicoccus sp. TaxID=1295329 RepID=UPI0026242B40|nr:hypothetical protein [uncultured Croceicoccus sp.]
MLQRLLHETQRRSLVPRHGDGAFERLIFVINGTPEVHHLTVYADTDLVETPVPMPKTAHPINALAPDVGRKLLARTFHQHPKGLADFLVRGRQFSLPCIAQIARGTIHATLPRQVKRHI